MANKTFWFIMRSLLSRYVRRTRITLLHLKGYSNISKNTVIESGVKFDKLGVFTYSREKLSKSYDMPEQVNEKIKEERKKAILDAQKVIVEEKNREKIGLVYNSIVEGKVGKDVYVVRPYFNARGIDDKVFAKSKELLISGSFVNVEIKKVKGYDLVGEVI